VDENPLASSPSVVTTESSSSSAQPFVDPEPTPVPPEPPYITGGPPFPPFASDLNKYGISILDYFAGRVISGLATRTDMSIDVLKADGPKHAYWIAAEMIQLRDTLPINPTPVPGPEEEPPQTDMIMPPDSLLPHGEVTVASSASK
jgi:hypothetical protein